MLQRIEKILLQTNILIRTLKLLIDFDVALNKSMKNRNMKGNLPTNLQDFVTSEHTPKDSENFIENADNKALHK